MRVAYLDIETDYVGPHTDERMFRDFANHRLTVIGIRVLGENEDTFHQFVGADATRENLLAALAGVERIITYNGRSAPDAVKRSIGFDFPVIAAQLGVTVDREIPHTDLVPLCWRRNLYGGLKKVEETLGLRRKLPGRNGRWAMDTWRRFQKSGDQALLDELLAYNKEDVFMLREVELALERR